MHASLALFLPLLGLAAAQGSCRGSITGNRCCPGSVITSDGGDVNTNDISNLVCCVGGDTGNFNFGATACEAGASSVPFSQLSTVGNNIQEGSTVLISNGNTIVGGTETASTMETETMSSTSAEETSSGSMTSSAAAEETSESMTSSESAASQSSTGTSTGGAVMMTSGPMAGALVMAGGFVLAVL
ncbi:unnamed protein product [Zymoseptoria tritici ST99CH_1A5]|uniref:Hydrophobin-like protein n=4 Tax=Zymoseptoria tritici TaxID=1047171 RepID=F9XK89_ZYMTI|nr:uncharacterized protein MYCGRDRAFT_95724 [Zymoseptoria tritici IPO323]SMQ54072.1 unnamed protein product [Zymoseptoria tritici ST99CH_3D7]SMR58506.1 unnamed protein product [Zymoseptoria tritici ST99CH_1E4]SMR61495.1 unnamed protein product [Zymoseptoria tritici ST99CH_3D1]SMY27705.1 unnamed protein product [Zymoseptoria tritici ST99CH_1A5]EGP84372.1 hypothetical protein MYCGRDRAFT_95724 [Zymoseptoria tritici IPO323]